MFAVRHPLFPAERCEEALDLARAFFRLGEADKHRLAIENSPHFRGYSIMQDHRDWREQIHFGREETARPGPPAYEQLRGPNLWPRNKDWRAAVLQLLADLETVGREVLAALAQRLGLPGESFLASEEQPYLLLKLIHYKASSDATPRSGVAPHVDFSWITLLLQDDTGGLEVRRPDGIWEPVPAEPGTLLVNYGEILDFASGGFYPATPHRVVTGPRSRLSMPFFLNPALDRTIGAASHGVPMAERMVDDLHVHRVFSEPRTTPFVYGDEEWQRKGEGVYCGACIPAKSRTRSSTRECGPKMDAPR